MRVYLWMLLLVLSMDGRLSIAQEEYPEVQFPRQGVPFSHRVQSRQGWPDKPDVIAHKHFSKGTHLACVETLHYPKTVDDVPACILKFDNGEKQILHHGRETQAPIDGEMYLECAGDTPTRCTIEWW